MPELKVNLEEQYDAMLRSLKPVAESIIEEPLDFDTYVSLVIYRGLRAIVEDLIGPQPQEDLIKSIVLMFEANPKFVSEFINNMLAAGPTSEEAKGRLGFVREKGTGQ